MSTERVCAYAIWLAIAAVTAISFRGASCQETVASYRYRIEQCQCFEVNRVPVVTTEKPE